ncbi:MAG: L,D-transpeptidase family protein [Alphaproteobacteria bacterium]|nr:L,D-transpeptidase family protein [Alphaproteobacteria bacterium]
MNITVYADGYLKAGDKIYRAVYGKNGIGLKIREGDGISPEGTWPLRRAFYRPDRLQKPATSLPIEAMTPNYAWCDVQGDPKYNQFVMLPYPVIDEKLWREDNLYDLVVVIGYNDDPVVDGKGSAIFLHVARPAYSPSAGCAAVSLPDLLEIMPLLGSESTLTFTRETLKGEAVKWPYNPPSE